MLNEILFQNWRSKLLALLSALTVWIYLNVVVSGDLITDITLKVENRSQDFIIRTSNQHARIHLKGPREILQTLVSNPLIAHYPLSDTVFSPEDKSKQIQVATKDFLDLPRDVYLAKAPNPEFITIEIHKSENKALEIIPRLHFDDSNNFQIDKITVEPTFVLAKIPASLFLKRVYTYTENIVIPEVQRPGNYSIYAPLVTSVENIPMEYLYDQKNVLIRFSVVAKDK